MAALAAKPPNYEGKFSAFASRAQAIANIRKPRPA
jgi:hypothetical protein